MLNRTPKIRFGLAAKLSLFVGVMLFALIGVILAIVFKQQRSTLSELAEREVTRFLSPVESLNTEIDQTAENLIRLERFRLRIQAHEARNKNRKPDYYNRFFDEKQLEAAENNLRTGIRPSEKSDPIDEKRFGAFQRRAAYFARNPRRTTKYGELMWNFERDLRAAVDYDQRIDIAFSGLNLDRYRAESIDRYRRPRFDTARLLSRLERRSPAPINAFVWRKIPALHEAILEVYEPFVAQRPLAEAQRHEFDTEDASYFVITRTQFRTPDVSERALLVKRVLNSSGLWRQYSYRERRVIADLQELAEKIETRLKELQNPETGENGAKPPPIPPGRDADLRDLFQKYEAALAERSTLVDQFRRELFIKKDPAYAAELSRLQKLNEELKTLRRNRNQTPEADFKASEDKMLTEIGEIRSRHRERDFSRTERVADAFEYLRDAALYHTALLSYSPDQSSYENHTKFANIRKLHAYRWRNLRNWVTRPTSETYLNPKLVGWALLTRTRTDLQSEMFRLDTTPLDRLVDQLLYETTAGFTRILVDQTEIRARIRAERDSFLDTALSIGLRSIFLAFLLSGLLVGAIRRIIAGAGRVGRGDLSVRFEYNGRDELGQLTDSLNNMVIGLQEREEMRGELQAAEEIQKRLIADHLPAGLNEHLSFGMFYKAMSGVGGDYYDFIEAGPGRFVFCVADVSNHGVGPAIVMTLMRSQLHSIVRRGETDPMRIILELNERTYADTPENIFITLFLGLYSTADSTIRYVSAGHNPAYIYRYRTEKLETVPAGGMPIGAVDNDLFAEIVETQNAQLGPGDLFFQYTDGVNEAMNDDDALFGTDRMEKVLQTLGRKRPDAIVNTLAQAVERFTGKKIFCDGPSELNDDIAMIAFRRLK
ncbi:MAG: SpoIIE family protein phosphatase [Leptospirales bacterium]|jgi:sigma-B regulation protein RsbU (phosphoserine phosphatase)